MGKLRTKLSVEGFEERLTPASTADFLHAAGQTAAAATFFKAISADPEWIFTPAARSFIVGKVRSIYQDTQSAAQTFRGTGMAAQAQTMGMVSQHIADMLGFSVTTPVPVTPKPPAPKPTDAGMTNTMPSATDPLWVTQANGLKTWDVVQGTGSPVVAGDSVTVFYTGWLASNGTKFDSRRSPAAPVTFSLNGLIQGWQQGIPGMKAGGIRRLFVPSALGYGAAGSPPNIPANADLIFEIKLTSHT